MSDSVIAKKKKHNRFGLIQLFIVLGLLAIVGVSFGVNVLPKKYVGVPEKLGDMKVGSVIEGSAAMAQVNRLHGTDIELVSAYIAEYSHDFNPYHNNDERITVWVGGAESTEAATELTMRMIEGMEKGGSGFSNLQRLSVADHEVFRVDGPGGEHFFYNSRERVIWLTIEAVDPLGILEEALKTF